MQTSHGGSMSSDGWINVLWQYTDHASDYGDLIAGLRQYASQEHPDAEVFDQLADYLDEHLTKREKTVPGSDALLPALVLILHALQSASNADEHKKIIKKLVE